MRKLNYLAYGSNLHPLRLKKRIPSSEVFEVIRLTGYRLHFQKRSIDGSGKCNIIQTNNTKDYVLGVVYTILESERHILDKIELGYRIEHLEVETTQGSLSVYTYIANDSMIDGGLQPYSWYRDMVLHGAHYHQFDLDYISHIMCHDAIEDPHETRHEENIQLLNEIKTNCF